MNPEINSKAQGGSPFYMGGGCNAARGLILQEITCRIIAWKLEIPEKRKTMVDKNIIGALKMRNIFLRYPNISFYNIVITKIDFYTLLNVKSSLLISSIVIALPTITIAIGCHSFSLFKAIALLFATAFKNNNYCYRNSRRAITM